jgi:hypothetical protein
LNYGSVHEVKQETLSDFSNSDDDDDDENVQQVESKEVSDTDTNSLTHSRRQKIGSKPADKREAPQKAGTDHAFMIRCILAGIAVILGLLCMCNLHGAQENAEKELPPLSVTVSESEREKYLRMDIKHISDEFPSQLNTTWQTFSAGIKMVQEIPTKPSIFLLLHETEEGTPACLAWRIGNISAHFLNATNPQPIILDAAKIEHNQTLVKDYGILLEEYPPMVKEQRAMIVKDLHKIPGIVAQSFHFLCDIEAPLVDKAIYLFTMKASGVSHAKDNPTKVAEEELNKLWNGQVDEDKLMPLIVRITNNVMIIMPEKNLMSCPDGAIVPGERL